MRIYSTFLFLLFSTILLQGQQSLNITLMDRWDVDTLPMAGGVQYNDVWGYTDCSGNEYGIIASASRIHFISLIDPNNIEEIASFPGGATTIWRDMKTFKDRAYAVSDNTNEGLMIFDLSDLPNSVTKTYQSSEFFSRSHNIFIDEEHGRLYSVGTDTQGGGVVVLDLNGDPDNPTLLASINLPADPNTQAGYVHDIYVKNNIAYASHGYLGYFIWDMNDPNNPILMASKETGGYNHSSWVSDGGNFAVYAEEVPTGRPLGVMNLENLSNEFIEIDTTFKFPLLPNANDNTPHNPFFRGNLLICSYYEDGLQVFDMSDRMNPVQVAYYDTHDNSTYNGYNGNWGTYPFLPSGLILASDIDNGLYVLQLDSSLNLAATTAPSYVDASNVLPASSEFCLGDSMVWEVPAGYDYTWIKDSVELNNDLSIFTVSDAGTYSVKISNQHCESISNEAVVIVNESPDISALPTDNILACDGESFSFAVPSGYDTYDWQKDGNTISVVSFVTISDAGNYQLITTNNGCTSESEIFNISFSNIPTVEIIPQGPTEFCQGGFINLGLETDAANSSFAWSLDSLDLGNDEMIAITQSGIYELEITSVEGCTNTANIEIIVNEPILPTITQDVNVLTSTTADYYQWYKDGVLIQNANSQSYTVDSPGEYYVGTVDLNGCFGNSNRITVEVVNTIELENVESISVFPNPVNELLQIQIELQSQENFQIEILSIDGKVLLQNYLTLEKNDNLEFDVSSFAQGVYFIKMKNAKGQLVRRFVKR